jgi:hypothetical protein
VTVLLASGCGKSWDTPSVAEPPPQDAESAPAPETELAQPIATQEPGEKIPLIVPHRGVLNVPVPKGALATTVDTVVPGGASLRIQGPETHPHVVTVTVLGEVGMMPNFGSEAWLAEELERWKAGLPGLETAARADPIDFEVENVRGVYVTMEDPNAEQGEYSRLLQGFFNADGCVVSFRVLHNETRASVVNRFLATLVEADWEPEAETSPEPPT